MMSDKLVGCRGWVKGFSMWPNLIPGDILSAELAAPESLKPGMVAVFAGNNPNEQVVHRVVSVRNFSGFTAVVTAGDNSGIDQSRRFIRRKSLIPLVTGVLRKGLYRDILTVKIPRSLSFKWLVRIHCGIVRRYFW